MLTTSPRSFLSAFRHDSITGAIFVLLLATVFTHIPFGSTPLPFGGPNVHLAAMAVFLSLYCALSRAFLSGKRFVGIRVLVEEFRPVIPIIAVSLLLTAWMFAVYLFNDFLAPERLMKTALGIGILFAVYLSVNSVRRATLMVMAIVLATFISALLGVGVSFVGDPFLTFWLRISTVRLENLAHILIERRVAGLSPSAIVFSYHLAVAVPLAFFTFLHNPFSQGRASTKIIYNSVLFVVLMTMVSVMILNSTRSAILGVLVGAVVVAFLSIKIPWISRRLLFIALLTTIWLLVFFNFLLPAGDIGGGTDDVIFSRDGTTVAGLASGNGGLANSGERPTIGHTIEGLVPWSEYVVQLRTRRDREYGPENGPIVAKSGHFGSVVLTWHETGEPGITGYQYRLRSGVGTEWRPWQDFTPSLSSRGPPIDALAAGGDGDKPGNGPIIVHTIVGLIAGVEYKVQLRARNEHGYGAASDRVTAAADDDGLLVLTWREPEVPTSITAYQLRLKSPDNLVMLWQDFVPSASGARWPEPELDDIVEVAHAFFYEGISRGGSVSIFRNYTESSVQSRTAMGMTALQYSADHELGTGVYSPDTSHLPADLDNSVVQTHILINTPHNQFLVVLVYYGFPGLILLGLFYVLVLWSLIHSGRFVLRSRDADLCFLVTAVAGALVAYGINSMLHNAGPFVGDWGHFFLIGLVFGIQRIVASREADGEAPWPA